MRLLFSYLMIGFTLLFTEVFGQRPPPLYDTLIQVGSEISFYFKYIPAGTFRMGSSPFSHMHEPDEHPVHEVTLSRGYYIGVYEVTQQQWQAVMHENPAVFQVFNSSPSHPVEYITWEQAQEFIARLNEMEIGNFRLPTEAEWEYACRAGTTTSYYWGDEMAPNGSSEYTWANSRSFARTHPVGLKKPNSWGLYDMSGNVWEWCQDWYASYKSEPQTDPVGPTEGSLKVFRGGSWFDFYEAHRSANRHKHAPSEAYTAIGMRLIWEDI